MSLEWNLGLDFELMAFDPGVEHGFESVLAGQENGLAFLFAMHVRVCAPGEQGARFVAGLSGFPQGDFRVGAQGHAFLLAHPVVAEMPGFAALGRDRERKSVEVAEDVDRAGSLRLPDGGVGECHAKLLEVRVMAWMMVPFAPFFLHKTRIQVTPIHGLKNGLKNSGCKRISVASGRTWKTNNPILSTT